LPLPLFSPNNIVRINRRMNPKHAASDCFRWKPVFAQTHTRTGSIVTRHMCHTHTHTHSLTWSWNVWWKLAWEKVTSFHINVSMSVCKAKEKRSLEKMNKVECIGREGRFHSFSLCQFLSRSSSVFTCR
jgi:hypothetical protein